MCQVKGCATAPLTQLPLCTHPYQDWLRHWPREQLLFLRYEDYIAAPRQHLEAVLSFLGIEATETDARAWEAMVRKPVSNSNRYPPMLNETRAMLEELYAEPNQELAGAFGDPRWTWHDVGMTSWSSHSSGMALV